MVAADLAAAEAAIERQLGLELAARDLEVASFGLRNALYPIGDQLLEVVSPMRDGTTAGRFLDKRGGDGGYMVIVQVDDLDEARRRIVDTGARVVYEAAIDGVRGIHLHPADVGGAILSVDATDVWEDWPWAGRDWRDHRRLDRVTAVDAVEIEAADPVATAARWSAVLGRGPSGEAGITVPLDEGRVDIVPAGERGEGIGGFVLRGAPGAAPVDTVICGCRFRTNPAPPAATSR